ncbi:hypothetical protein G7046_g7085 [Stylonectria norvegica]|nr:hypothetical protein G7046_g7085 [Stylonectria norvegica]
MSTPEPQLLITIIPSSPTLSLGSEPFSITLQATISGTDNAQPITVLTVDTLFHPAAGREALEYQGLVFTDTTTNLPAKRLVLDITRQYPEGGFAVSLQNQQHFAEIPSDEATDREPFSVTYTFKSSGTEAFLDPKVGFEAGREYKISLGRKMSCIRWWRVGMKGHVLAEGDRDGSRVDLQPDPSSLQMLLSNEATFRVVD